MEVLFLSVQKQIATQVQELADVDLDWGQLLPGQDYYPVNFPCALVKVEGVAWNQQGSRYQDGLATVVVTVAAQMSEDTHYKSGRQHKALEALDVCRKVSACLHRYAGGIIADDDDVVLDGHFTPLERKYSRMVQYEGAVTAEEFTFTCQLYDPCATAELTKVADVEFTPNIVGDGQ